MKIGLVIPKFVAGGAEQVVMELAMEYKNLGHEVVIISMSSGGNMLNRFKKSCIKLKEFDLDRQFRFSPVWLVDVAKARKRIKHFLKEESFDVVHIHLMGPEIDFLHAARWVKTKVVVYTIHSVYRQFCSKEPIDKIKNWRRRKAYIKYDHIYAVDDEVKDWAIKCNMIKPDHISVVRNGIDFSRLHISLTKEELRRKYGWNQDEIVILNIGRLTEPKNQIALIRAIHLIFKKGINLRLVIVGDGPLKSFLEDEVRTLSLNHRVQLLGYREDIPSLLKAADVFAFPSLWEGLPIALLEALACDIRVVASNIPIHRKILGGGNFGWLTSISSPEEISDSILNALKNIESTNLKVSTAKKMVLENFSSKRMANDYIESYLKILKNKGIKLDI